MKKTVLSLLCTGAALMLQSFGNPYLPLWEHLPDGEPRVFEDPDRPGKYRAYIMDRTTQAWTATAAPTYACGQHR